MPGKKDCVKVIEEGETCRVQKRLLLKDIHALHTSFCFKYPEFPISVSKFTKLRPRNCITISSSGTYNICVCKIHQNMKLKLLGLNDALKSIPNFTPYCIENIINDIKCASPTAISVTYQIATSVLE